MKYALNQDWYLHEFPLGFQEESVLKVLHTEQDWMRCDLPADVTDVLVHYGKALEPTCADQFEKNHWIEKRSWWFRKTFSAEELPDWKSASCVELRFGALDLMAKIYVNGVCVGEHRSAHYEFRKDIKEELHAGENTLLVRLSVGLETVSDQDLAEVNFATCTEGERTIDERSDLRRSFLRKPQYVFGWDWSPRIATCGIMDEACIEIHHEAVIRHVTIHTVSAGDDLAVLSGEIEVENLSALQTRDGDLQVQLLEEGKIVYTLDLKDQLLCSGLNYFPFTIQVDHPKIWWPNGMGEHFLYQLKVSLQCNGFRMEYPMLQVGIRTIALDCSRLDAQCRQFALIVNGVRIFMKGGDWVPPDPLYGRITNEKLRTLIEEAANANFNSLRVWGGGIYNRDIFYELCDQYGILLWHDFMFACSAYPDHLEWYQDLCRKELNYQTRRLCTHACIALFCGNNEDHEIFNWETGDHWGIHGKPGKQYGLYISNVMAREMIHQNCPYIPYWNSSPYGGPLPQSQEVGDVHYWHKAMMSQEMSRRIDPYVYDEVTARFVSEYGYVGPTRKESIQEYMGEHPLDRESRIWRLHNNSFEKKTVVAGIQKHYTEKELSLEEYLLYGGLVQGTLLGYSLEAFRAKLYCCGGIFWMYDDCWGEVGWTIIDYYLRRKIAFYGVRRAFAPIKLILRQVEDKIELIGANDTSEAIDFTASIGVISFHGTPQDAAEEKDPSLITFNYTMAPHSRSLLGSYEMPEYDPSTDCFAVIPSDERILPETLRRLDARNLHIHGQAEILEEHQDGENLILRIRANSYTHAVYIDTDLSCSDNYFDMLPSQERTITIYHGKNLKPTLHWVF